MLVPSAYLDMLERRAIKKFRMSEKAIKIMELLSAEHRYEKITERSIGKTEDSSWQEKRSSQKKSV